MRAQTSSLCSGGGDRRSGHTLDGWLKEEEEEEPSVEHVASGKVNLWRIAFAAVDF